MKKRYLDTIKRELKVYYARAIDDIDYSEILRADLRIQKAINQKGFFLVNPYKKTSISVEQLGNIVDKNTELLKESDVLLADLTIKDYTYIGAIFEIVQAVNFGIPTVICVGNTNYKNRLYLHHYCDFICRTVDEGFEYIWRFLSHDGIEHQLREEEEFYEAIAANYYEESRKTYADKEKDIEKYERERITLREKLEKYCRNKSVLELGCGSGDWTQTITEVAKSVTCIDISTYMINEAKKRLIRSPIQPYFICGDFLDETLSIEPCEVVVSYFTLSLFPPIIQNILLSNMKNWVTTGGYFLFGESMQISTISSIGMGRRRIQCRTVGRRDYIIYKDHFSPDRLQALLNMHQFEVFDISSVFRWFAFCCAHL
jgi:SAM-dependent methyltransferase